MKRPEQWVVEDAAALAGSRLGASASGNSASIPRAELSMRLEPGQRQEAVRHIGTVLRPCKPRL